MEGIGKDLPKTPEIRSTEQSVPFGFEPVPLGADNECPSLESTKHSKQKEIWLIKVPDEFDSSSLTGKNIVLNGTQDVTFKNSKGTKSKFEVVSKPVSNSLSGSSKALLPSCYDASLWTAKTFGGSMSVVRSVSVPTPHSPPLPEHSGHVAPEITCRWKPFGYKKTFNSTTKRKTEKTEKENNEDQKFTQQLAMPKFKHETSKSERKEELTKSGGRKRHKGKSVKIEQEEQKDGDESLFKNKKIKIEKLSPVKDIELKIGKITPAKEQISKAKTNEIKWPLIPLDAEVKAEVLSDQERKVPKKKRKKEKIKQ